MKFKPFAVLLAAISFLTYSIAFNLLPSTGSVKAENYSFINKKGLLVIKPQFSEVKNFSQGLAAVKIGDKWGFIDKTGKQLAKPQFTEAESFSQGLAAVKIGDEWGYINKTGEIVIKPQFLTADPFYEGLAVVNIDGESTYIDRRGIVAKPASVNIYRSSEGLQISFKKDGDGTCGPVLCVYGYVDETGKTVVEPKFFEVREFSEGLAAVLTNDSAGGVEIGEWGYINKRGQFVIEPIFSEANSFSQGLAAVEIGRKDVYSEKSGETLRTQIAGKWGCINGTGKQVIFPRFNLANSFSEGLAAVWVKDKCGYINKIGKIVVKRRFSACEDFSEGLAAVKTPAR